MQGMTLASFNSTHSFCHGKNTPAPAPYGPGFCLQGPSVKMSKVPTSLLPISHSICILLSSSCASVPFFDDPRLFQYAGRLIVGCKDLIVGLWFYAVTGDTCMYTRPPSVSSSCKLVSCTAHTNFPAHVPTLAVLA